MFVRMNLDPGFKSMETSYSSCAKYSYNGNGRSQMEEVKVENSTWEYRLDLSEFPTKPADLQLNMNDGTLTLSGKSEVTGERSGINVFSTHIWSKEIQVPKSLKKETLKAKFNDQNILTLTGELQPGTGDINIEIN